MVVGRVVSNRRKSPRERSKAKRPVISRLFGAINQTSSLYQDLNRKDNLQNHFISSFSPDFQCKSILMKMSIITGNAITEALVDYKTFSSFISIGTSALMYDSNVLVFDASIRWFYRLLVARSNLNVLD